MKDTPIFYGDSACVNSLGNKDYADYLKNTEKKQSLPGFDAQYLDIVDYILKITHRIWEEKGIGVIYDTYHNDVQIHSGASTAAGMNGVIAGTLATLHAFPDRRLIGEDVIWSEDRPGYFLSSHRILSTGTNMGDSSFGSATGKRIHFRTIADCAITENRIYEEWLVRDNLSIVQQLGLDPMAVARRLAAAVPATERRGMPEPTEGQFYPAHYAAKDDSVGEMLLELLGDIYNRKLLCRVRELFTDNAVLHTVGNCTLVGFQEIQGGLISLLSSFPNARYSIDRITCNDQSNGTQHVAVRWRLRGLHDGLGQYGTPTGKAVDLLGITHYRVVNSRVTEAWEVYDALDVLRQLCDAPDSSTV